MTDTNRHRKPRERPALHLPEQAAGFALTVAFLAVLGPFGTSNLAPLTRITYWALSIGAG